MQHRQKIVARTEVVTEVIIRATMRGGRGSSVSFSDGFRVMTSFSIPFLVDIVKAAYSLWVKVLLEVSSVLTSVLQSKHRVVVDVNISFVDE